MKQEDFLKGAKENKRSQKEDGQKIKLGNFPRKQNEKTKRW